MTKPNTPKPKDDVAKPVKPPDPPKSRKVSPNQNKSRSPKKSKQQQQESRSFKAILTGKSSTPQANQRPLTPKPIQLRKARNSESKPFKVKPIPKGDVKIWCLDLLLDFVDDLNCFTEDGLEEKKKKLEEKIGELPSFTPKEFSKILFANIQLQQYSFQKKTPNKEIQEVFYVSSTVPQERIDDFLRIKYGNDFKNTVRKVRIPPKNFCVKDTLNLTFDKFDPTFDILDPNFNIHKSRLKEFTNWFNSHCLKHPEKGRNFELAGFDSENFNEFFRKEFELCLNNKNKCACIIEGSKLRFFVYGGSIEGFIRNNNESAPRYYCFGFQQQRLTLERFAQLKTMTDHPEYDQIFEAAVSRQTDIDMAAEGKNITPRRTRIVEQKARRDMEQLRRDDPSQYSSYVEDMLDTEVIWSRYDLRFGTGWLIHNYTYAYKDLKGEEDGVAEADVGSCLEVDRMKQSSDQE